MMMVAAASIILKISRVLSLGEIGPVLDVAIQLHPMVVVQVQGADCRAPNCELMSPVHTIAERVGRPGRDRMYRVQ